MEDLTQKVESIFGVRKFGQNIDSYQSIAFPADFISDVVDLLPIMLNHFNKVAEQLKLIIESASNGDDDSEGDGFSEDLFTDEANLIKVCFGLCIRLLAALFTWPEFADDANAETLNRKSQFQIGNLKY